MGKKKIPKIDQQNMSWDIAFAGFVTYNHTTWDIALVQKGRKKKGIWRHSNRIHF